MNIYDIDYIHFLIRTHLRHSPELIKGFEELLAPGNLGDRFVSAPASSKVAYHHAYKGGLLDHSVDVYNRMVDLNEGCRMISTADALIVALLHDLHKVGDVFGEDYYNSNILKSGKQSDALPYVCNKGCYEKRASVIGSLETPAERATTYFLERTSGLLRGGDLSLELVYGYSPLLSLLLTDDQKFAIRYHDGAYVTSKYDSEFKGKETPLQIITHAADMLSARLNSKHNA